MSSLFPRLSIRSKIIVGFVAVLACTVGFGLFSNQRLDAVIANAQSIKDDYLPSTRVLGHMAQVSERLRSNRASQLLATTDTQRSQYDATVKEQAALYTRERDAYQPLIGSVEELRLAAALDAAWKQHLETGGTILGLMTQGRHDEAVALFMGDGVRAMARYREALQADIDFNVLQATQATNAGEALGASAHRWILAGLVLAGSLCVAVGWTIVRGISKPICAMTAAMRRLATGDTTVEIVGTGRSDEIGAMSQAVEVFKSNAIERTRLEAEQKQQELRAAKERQIALLDLAESIEAGTTAALEGIGSRSEAMAATAEAMKASADRTGSFSESASAAAAQALANAQTVASAAEQLTVSIREIGGQVNQSNQVVGRAVAAGSDTRATIETLNEQVARIGTVADMISEIAAKTNLLALNATIEAARAGDAGKGFAVVASEVKALATQTARSTQEIAQHISQVRTATGASVEAVARIEQTIGEINAISSSIAAAVEEQGAATAEIARNVAESTAAADTMTTRTSEVSAEAAQTGRRAVDVLENTTALNTSVEELRQAVITAIRASGAGADRGEHRRRPCLADAIVDCQGSSGKAVIRDISEAGCLAETPMLCQAGQRIEVALSRFSIRLQGSVVHSSPQRLLIDFVGDGLPTSDADRVSLETISDLVRLTKEDHVAFVRKVVNAVESREIQSQGSLATTHHCRLGRWYDGVNDSATLALGSFKAIEVPHHAVHDSGRRALAALAADDMAAAEREVAAMREASTRVLQGLDAFGQQYLSIIGAGGRATPGKQR